MIQLFFPIILQVFKWFVQRHNLSEETKQKFYEFVKMSEKSSAVTTGIRNEFKSQLENLIVSGDQKSDEKNSPQ